jgi:hypothetical protein
VQFGLFILLNAVLFLRPAELVPALEGLPIYESLIWICIAFAVPAVGRELTVDKLKRQPTTICVFAVLGAIVASQVGRGGLGEAITRGTDYAKIIIYYLLLVAIVNTPAKLHRFLWWIGLLTLGMTAVVLLDHYGIVELPSTTAVAQAEIDPETGDRYVLPRLRGIGIFSDPNDLSVVLVMGMMIGLYQLGRRGWARPFWAASTVVMGYALTLTHSRGGFLALLAALVALLAGRVGLKKALILGGPLAFGLAVLLGGRQTNIDLGNSDDTSQHRIRLWRDGLVLLQSSPVFGIGAGRYEEEVGLVAHNSFVHAYTELGLLGGTAFLGAFLFPVGPLYRLGAERTVLPPSLRTVLPCVVSCAVGVAAGMMSLTRVYTVTPYIVLGVVTAFLGLVGRVDPTRGPRLTTGYVARLLALGAVFLVLIRLFVQLFAGTG